jgi:hypothetical protein
MIRSSHATMQPPANRSGSHRPNQGHREVIERSDGAGSGIPKFSCRNMSAVSDQADGTMGVSALRDQALLNGNHIVGARSETLALLDAIGQRVARHTHRKQEAMASSRIPPARVSPPCNPPEFLSSPPDYTSGLPSGFDGSALYLDNRYCVCTWQRQIMGRNPATLAVLYCFDCHDRLNQTCTCESDYAYHPSHPLRNSTPVNHHLQHAQWPT